MARQVRERHTEIEARELADRGEQIGSFPERFHDAAAEARDAEETTPAEPVEAQVRFDAAAGTLTVRQPGVRVGEAFSVELIE